MYSSSVTDAEWAILEPLLPAPGSTAGRGGRPEKHCRPVIGDAILYIVRGGIAWRQLPVEFPPAATVYAVFARWAGSGGWQRILDALRDRLRVRAGRDRCPTAAIIDSQTVPAADTVPRSRRGWDGGKRTNGVTRHLAGDVNGLLLAVVVTAASIQDRDAAHRLLAALRGSFSTIRVHRSPPPRPPQRREVAKELREVADTFAEVPDGKMTSHVLGVLAHLLDPT